MLRALLAKLSLPTQHYLTRAVPLPTALVAAAAICHLPDSQAYALLASAAPPAAATALQPANSMAACAEEQHAAAGSCIAGGKGDGSATLPGMVEVRAAPRDAVAAAPASGARSGTVVGPALLEMPLGVRLAALRSLRQQLQQRLRSLGGGSALLDSTIAAAARPGSGTYQALVSTKLTISFLGEIGVGMSCCVDA